VAIDTGDIDMPTITPDLLLATARANERKTLETSARGKKFTVTAHNDTLEIMPEDSASGKPKMVPRSEMRKFCDEYEKSGSTSPGHYSKLTGSASYLLRLVELM